MRDVAELAGVGTMTVSRVLNGTVHVTEETSRRVFRAIEALQYKPNQLARALRGSRSHTIGVLVPYLYDPFFATCAHAIDTVAQRHGYSVLLTTTNENAAIEVEAIRQMAQWQVNGLIIRPVHSGYTHLRREARNLPIVTLDRPSSELAADSVQVENMVAGRLGTSHLLEHGHRRICFIALSRELSTMRDRHDGYEEAMHRAGLKGEAHFDCFSQETVTHLLQTVCARRDPPTAILTSNGLTTRYVLHGLAQLGIKIPSQMALVGFDDIEFTDLLQPGLKVIRQPVSELGEAAADLLFERLDESKLDKPARQLVLPVELVIRGSCGCDPSQPMAALDD
jgi:LacI family transcriptional regulator